MKKTKEELRLETEALLAGYDGGITRCPSKLAGGSDDRMFAHSRQSMKEMRSARR